MSTTIQVAMFEVSWAEIRPHLEALLDASAEQRSAYSNTVLGDQPRLRREVIAFLRAETADPSLLESDAAARFPNLAAELSKAPDAESDALIGRRIHQWTVRGILGRGGMATVYRVDREGDGFTMEAALKLLPLGLDTPSLRARFRTEQDVLSRLRHPGIAHLLDGGLTDDGRPFVVMELVEGRLLLDHCSSEDIDLDGRLKLLREICEAVAFAHRRLIIHRDIKPSNVLVTAEGQVKLLDFGIAKVLAGDEDSPPTQAYTPMTPAYASPEQRLGDEVTTASDVYSLGVLMWELLLGTRPPPDNARVRSGAPSQATSDGSLKKQLAGDLDAIILHCLELRHEDRYLGPADLAQDLERYLEGAAISIRRIPRRERLKRWVARNRLAAAALAIATMSLIGGTVASSVSSHQAVLERNRAVQEASKARSAMAFVEGLLQASASDQLQGETITVRELLTKAEQRLVSDHADEVELQLEISTLLTELYLSLSLNFEAVVAAQRNLELIRASGGSVVDIALRQQRLGYAWISAGQPLEAQPELDASLTALEQALGELAPEVIAGLRYRSYADVGLSPTEINDIRGLILERERRASGGRDTPGLAQSLNDHSRSLFYLGYVEEALVKVEEAIAMRHRLGSSALALQVSLGNQALVLMALGDPEGAERAAREALALGISAFGRGQMETATPLMRLAQALRLQGRLEEGLTTAREVVDIQRTFVPGHIRLGKSLRVLALIECDLGQMAMASQHLEEAERLIAAQFPGNGWRAAEVRAARGKCLALAGNRAEARQLLVASRDEIVVDLTAQSPVVREIDRLLLGLGSSDF